MNTATGNLVPSSLTCNGAVMLRFKQANSSIMGSTPSLGSIGPKSVEIAPIEGEGGTGLAPQSLTVITRVL
jgi:hypothetical protein